MGVASSAQNILRVLTVALAFSFIGVVMSADLVEAGWARQPANTPEQEAYNLCHRYYNGSRGAIWVTSSDTRWYYGNSVNVTDNTNSASVDIRGSIYSCNYGSTQYTWAVDVRAGRVGDRDGSGNLITTGGNGARLTNLKKNTLYRGFTNSTYTWSNYSYGAPGYGNAHPVDQIAATLNVSGIATSYNSEGIAKGSITVPIYRCFWGSGSNNFASGSKGTCYAQNITVNVVRTRTIKWTLTPTTTINKTTANPGETITWTHRVKNEAGSASTSVAASAAGGAKVDGTDTTYTQTPWTIDKGFKAGATSEKTSTYLVKSSDVGKNICRGTTVSHYNQSTSGWTGWQDQKCVNIPYNYNLTPTVTIPGGNIVEPGTDSKIAVTGNVNNAGPTTSSSNGNWQLSRVVFNNTPTQAQKDGGDNSAIACSWSLYNSGKKSCTTVKSGTWNSSINSGGNFSEGIADDYLTEDHPVGTTVCYVLSISPYSAGSTGWRHSKLQCLTYGKKPKVQVWGGDLLAGRTIGGSVMRESKIDTSISTKNFRRVEEVSITTPVTFGGPATANNDISGVWRTGVNDAEKKIGPDINDPHWKIRTIFNDAGRSTCVRGYYQNNVLGGPSPAVNIGNVDWQAVTVGELNDKLTSWPTTLVGGLQVGAAGINTTNFKEISGGVFGSPRYVWAYIRDDARWLGANVYAHDYSGSSCPNPTDPTKFPGYAGGDMTAANTTVFTLRGGINIKDSVDLDKLSFTANLTADNVIKFFANGKELKASSGARMYSGLGGNWQEPGWWSTSTAGTNGKTLTGENAFKHGNNTFEIHVKSTFTNTGLMLYNFGFKGNKTVTETREVVEEKTYGSWGEYALVANGQIKGMASGAGFNHPDGSSKAQDTWSNITFANTFKTSPTAGGCTSANRWGCYVHSNPNMPDLSAKFSTGTSIGTGNISINSLAKKIIYVRNGGVINLGGGTLNKGEWIVINAKGTSTVNITSNINYTNTPITNANEIPQMVIIADNINIAPDVTNVDAWLVANNSLATCNNPGDASNLNTTNTAYNLSSNDCNQVLRVNGPVMSKKLWLRRTAGAGTGDQTGDPAEIFNYRPDAMLWLNNQFNNTALRTTNIKELPPRY